MALGSNCMAPSHGNNVVTSSGSGEGSDVANLRRGQQAKPVKIQNRYRGGLILVGQVGGNAQPGNSVDNAD